RNFAANGLTGHFTWGFVARRSRQADPPDYSIDDFLEAQHLQHIDVLHADIQGAELDMIYGASRTLSDGKVRYLFISTHGEDLHADCISALSNFGYRVPISVRPSESYSFDGLIVAHQAARSNVQLPVPSRKIVGSGAS